MASVNFGLLHTFFNYLISLDVNFMPTIKNEINV